MAMSDIPYQIFIHITFKDKKGMNVWMKSVMQCGMSTFRDDSDRYKSPIKMYGHVRRIVRIVFFPNQYPKDEA